MPRELAVSEAFLGSSIHVNFTGENGSVRIADPGTAQNVLITVGEGSSVDIQGGGLLGQLFIHTGKNAKVRIGKNAGVNGFVRLLLHEAASITIGDDCLFSGLVDLTVSDMHSIIDVETKQRINPAKDIVIGNHVWIGQKSTIMKGVTIGDDSVIGAGSIVTKSVPPNCIAAGSPARVIRRGVTWSNELLQYIAPTIQPARYRLAILKPLQRFF